jgi:tetrathionate reductase subunit B
MQCDRPICVEACPTRATFRDENDGIVKVNTELCIGCGSCIPACPYGARYRHPVRRVVDKCDYCLRTRLPLGKTPACVETCPTRARVFGNILDPASEASRLLKEKKTVRVVNQRTNTEPAIYYLGTTSPTDWPVEAKAPVPIQLWRDLFNPVVKGLVGLTGLGVLIMLCKQLLISDEKPVAPGRGAGKEEGNGNRND